MSGHGGDAVQIVVDGRPFEIAVDPLTPLREVVNAVLEDEVVVEPCAVGACGGCTVLVAGTPRLACLTPVGLVMGESVTTIRGLPPDDPIVEAFIAETAFQCAYCTPGFVLATHGLLTAHPRPSRRAIVDELAGNLCRCGSYLAIIAAVGRAAATRFAAGTSSADGGSMLVEGPLEGLEGHA
jgi:aerobic-type carbon monoxide dehydrogenase small subunit (CoxS/CutS family)